MLAVRAAANACRYQPFNEDKGTGLLRHCLLRRGVATGQVMVVLVTAQPVLPGAKNFVKALLAEAEKRGVPVTTVVQNYNPRRTSVVLGEDEKSSTARASSSTPLRQDLRPQPRSFYQVNPVQTAVLYGLAVDAAHLTGKEVVLDAYCGIGTIGLTASDAQGPAGGGRGSEPGRRPGRHRQRQAQRRKNARFFAADATAWRREAADAGQKADVVFMDPPRGFDARLPRERGPHGPKRIVYVSCNPETMARDLALLTQKGYRAEGFTPVDMFPHSAHCEVVGSLVRVK